MKKQLLILLLIFVFNNIKSQVNSMQYTYYSQIDTVSRQLMKDIPYNTTIFVDYYKYQISIEDNDNKFILDIVYSDGNQDHMFYQCLSSDKQEWKISIFSTKTQYLCVLSKDNFMRIFKRQR